LSLCHELSTTSMFSLSLHDALPIFEAFAVWTTYSTKTVIFTLPRSINLLASVRNASSRSDTTLGKRKLSSKNLELRDFNSTVYLTRSFSWLPIPYPVIDFIIFLCCFSVSVTHFFFDNFKNNRKDRQENNQ